MSLQEGDRDLNTDEGEEDHVMGAEGSNLTEKMPHAGFEDGGRGHELRNAAGEGGKCTDVKSVQEPTEESQLCQHLDSSPLKPLWTSVILSHQVYSYLLWQQGEGWCYGGIGELPSTSPLLSDLLN